MCACLVLVVNAENMGVIKRHADRVACDTGRYVNADDQILEHLQGAGVEHAATLARLECLGFHVSSCEEASGCLRSSLKPSGSVKSVCIDEDKNSVYNYSACSLPREDSSSSNIDLSQLLQRDGDKSKRSEAERQQEADGTSIELGAITTGRYQKKAIELHEQSPPEAEAAKSRRGRILTSGVPLTEESAKLLERLQTMNVSLQEERDSLRQRINELEKRASSTRGRSLPTSNLPRYAQPTLSSQLKGKDSRRPSTHTSQPPPPTSKTVSIPKGLEQLSETHISSSRLERPPRDIQVRRIKLSRSSTTLTQAKSDGRERWASSQSGGRQAPRSSEHLTDRPQRPRAILSSSYFGSDACRRSTLPIVMKARKAPLSDGAIGRTSSVAIECDSKRNLGQRRSLSVGRGIGVSKSLPKNGRSTSLERVCSKNDTEACTPISSPTACERDITHAMVKTRSGCRTSKPMPSPRKEPCKRRPQSRTQPLLSPATIHSPTPPILGQAKPAAFSIMTTPPSPSVIFFKRRTEPLLVWQRRAMAPPLQQHQCVVLTPPQLGTGRPTQKARPNAIVPKRRESVVWRLMPFTRA